MDGFIGAAQAVSGMAAGDVGPKLPYTAIFNRALFVCREARKNSR
jgi:hypothetical protein